MKLEKTVFSLIIPLTCEKSSYEKAKLQLSEPEVTKREFEQALPEDKKPGSDSPLWFRTCFAPSPIGHTTQLGESPLINPDSASFICRFSLSQRMREKVSIAKNESTDYYIKSGSQGDDIPFKIGKICLWFLPSDFAFVTITIHTDSRVSQNSVLDALAKLNDIKAKAPIRYDRHVQVENGYKLDHMNISVKQILQDLLSIQSYIPLHSYEKIDSMKSYCLFCGIGETESMEGRESFLSMVCMQRKSSIRQNKDTTLEESKVQKYQNDDILHIRWAVSRKVLAVYGDLTSGGKENLSFLTDALSHTVQQNYLPVYLHCLSVLLKEKNTVPRISREQLSLTKDSLTADEKTSIRQLLDIPLHSLTDEDRINGVFDFVINSAPWQLNDRLQILRRFLRKRIREIGEGIKAEPYEGVKPYAFISYSHKNREIAETVVKNLQSAGFRLWFDRYIEYGDEWDDIIAQKIEDCSCIVCMVSAGYIASENCKDEHSYAKELKIPRILVYLEEVDFSGGFILRSHRTHAIQQYQYKDLNEFYDDLSTINVLQDCKENTDA
ncbi:MAG: toll/interleukin-1 receptor domain-containing protein [Clostridium sp.]|nr:toll/interleukin-1 receptor domain-containing protein [Clostridium sp.]